MNCCHCTARQTGNTFLFLFPGAGITFYNIGNGVIPLETPRPLTSLPSKGPVLEILHCQSGMAVWHGDGETGKREEAQPDTACILSPGAFSLHLLDTADTANSNGGADRGIQTDSGFQAGGGFQGFRLLADLGALADNPPALLADTPVFDGFLPAVSEILAKRGAEKPLSLAPVIFQEPEESDHIFSGFYGHEEPFYTACCRLKALELFLFLSRFFARTGTPDCGHREAGAYPPEQIRLVRQIHDELIHNLDRRITIEDLSRQYLMNPTTLKAMFKSVYGTSLAAHVKEHRMERAAELLLETGDSMAQIARAVGYESQSKFTTAFKEFYQTLPTEYRRQHKRDAAGTRAGRNGHGR